MSIFTRHMARKYGGMAQFYETCTAGFEAAGVAAIRHRLAADLRGHVLEIGCGTGLNFPHYAAPVQVTAVELEEDYRAFATQRAGQVEASVTVIEGDAQQLPFEDDFFDAGLCTLVLCSVSDPSRGLAEVRRVVRTGAPVRFFEHVRSPRRWVAAIQDVTNPLWSWLMDGCNINRDTVATIRAAGFTVNRVHDHFIRAPQAPRFPLREIHTTA